MTEEIVAAFADYRMTEPASDENLPLVSFDQIMFETDDGDYYEIDFDAVNIDIDDKDPHVIHVRYTDPDPDACDDPEEFAERLDELASISAIRLLMEPENETFTIAEILDFQLVTEFDEPADAFDRDAARFIHDVHPARSDENIAYVYRNFPKDMLDKIEVDDG